LANDLNGNHYGNDKEGDAFGHELLQISKQAMFGNPRPLSTEEDDYRQRGRDVDIGCSREGPWNEAQEVAEEDEEEKGGNEGKPCQSLFPQGLEDEVGTEKVNYGLYEVLETRWNELRPSSAQNEEEKRQAAGNPHHDDRLGYGQVDTKDMDLYYGVKFEVVQKVHWATLFLIVPEPPGGSVHRKTGPFGSKS